MKADGKQWVKFLKVMKEVNQPMIPITKGKIQTAKKVIIYGPEGIGKSTLAAQFPNPVFIDTEGSTKELDVARYPAPTYWSQIIEEAEDLLEERNFSTLVIDTADWAEKLCIAETCSRLNVKGIEDVGYGKGYVYLYDDFQRILVVCDKLVAAGINVVFTAHAQMRKFEQPDELGAYDRWEMKLTKKIAPLLKEWADIVLFCNYKTTVITDQNTKSKKATGGSRVMYSTHHPCWDAKNRYNLPEQMEMSFEPLSALFDGVEPEPDYRAKLREVMKDMTEEQKADVIKKYNLGPATDNNGYKKAYEDITGGNSYGN
jgi:energy-coupling factor transporter ATP-binding protein EcfA2